MAKFAAEFKLNESIHNIFVEAKRNIILISPFIKLHSHYESALKQKITDDELALIVVFGKNEQNLAKSLRPEDLDFFKSFPNVEIRYEKRLHAKYYANENYAVISSMNLYDFSQDHNKETGIVLDLRTSLWDDISEQMKNEKTWEQEAKQYFDNVIEEAELIFKKEPVYEKSGLLGMSQKYKESKVVVDKIDEFFNANKTEKAFARKTFEPISSLPKEKPEQMGYCIRTGVKIPFNIERPMCDEAYKTWSRYKDEDYGEKYDHFTGEPSNGETSFARPIMKKNWKAAKEKFNL